MDLWEFNKIAAAVLLSLLVIVGANTAIPILYPEGGPGQVQVVEVQEDVQTAEAEPQAEEPPQIQPLPVLLASADPSNGQTVARQCSACHVFEEGGANRVGPHLWAVPGRQVASIDGFAYSNALQEYAGEWSYERLDCFLENPSECVPGTSMAYSGVKDPQDRADLIAYLASLGDTPPFPEPEESAEAPAESDQAAAPEAGTPAQQQADAQEEADQTQTDMAAAEEPAGAGASGVESSTASDPASAAAEAASGNTQLAALFANASAADGESAVRVCAACHSFDEGGAHRIGPNLYGIMGNDIAAVDGFNNYSNALQALDGDWTYERMNAWLKAPMDYVEGTTMAYAGVKDDAERANIMAYLASLGDAPLLPGTE